jgi:hypothetical protein
MKTLDAETVRTLADVQGYGDVTSEFAERVAAGADRAIAAVRASVDATLFDAEPAQFLPVLEALAEPGDGQ